MADLGSCRNFLCSDINGLEVPGFEWVGKVVGSGLGERHQSFSGMEACPEPWSYLGGASDQLVPGG